MFSSLALFLVAQLDPGGMSAQGPAPDKLTQLIPGVGGFVTGGGITVGAVLALVRGYVARIDRGTPWGNPYVLGEDGDRTTVIDNYERHYLEWKPSLTSKLQTLRGKALGCWCAPEPCHGDVLRRWAQ